MKRCLSVILWVLGITMLMGSFGGFASEKTTGNIAMAIALLILGGLAIFGAVRLGIAARRQAELAAQRPPSRVTVWVTVGIIIALAVFGFLLIGKNQDQEVRRLGFFAIAVPALLLILLAIQFGRRRRELYYRCYLECPCGFKGVGKLCNNYSPWLTLLLLGFDRLFTAMWYKAHTDREYVKCPRCGRIYYPRN